MAIFSSLVTGTMGMFGTYAYQVSGAQREYYPVTEQCVVYDMSANLIPMTSQGTVKRDWSGEWELKLEDGSTFDLGENAVVYDGGVVKVFGGGYRVKEDKAVERLGAYTEVDNLEDDGFYKLADRRYLLTGEKIEDTNHLLKTSKYLHVVMDRAGNAICMNDELCVKT